ncbi:MAG: HAD family hydrolase [Oscillospiraceae bacterium]|nr:HAD family hydrolase [Oscillospiraceae bacterium]
MSIKMVLFDLDGTLLPMDQEAFTKKYFGLLAAKLAPHGYEPEQLIAGIWSGTAAMVKNTGEKTNEEAFWIDFTGRFGEQTKADIPLFDEFYRTDFAGAKAACGYNPMAAETVKMLKNKGIRVALATNPIFPAIATENRIRWAGLEPEDFELYTTYENSSHCKPNPDYYRAVLEQLGVDPKECLMVGNDVKEDMIAGSLGMQVFLLTDCLINKAQQDISVYPHGGFLELQQFLKEHI